jgi:hypothetical protein
LKIENRITKFTKKIFEKEHQRFATQIRATTEICITKLKAEADGLRQTQLMAQERHNQTVIKQGIDTLERKAEKKQDETLDLLDVKASELENYQDKNWIPYPDTSKKNYSTKSLT